MRSPQTVFNYVCEAIKQTVPVESARQVLALEMARLDTLFEEYNPRALKGDDAAAKIVLKIISERAKLCGLYPQSGQPNLNVNIGGEVDAREGGIQVRFVKGGWEERPDGSLWQNGKMVQPPEPPKQIEAAKVLPSPASFGPNVLTFERC